MMGKILKCGCIFIILMYCLAPLCANGLGMDDNSKYDISNLNDGNVLVEDTNDFYGVNEVNSDEKFLRIQIQNTTEGNYVKIEAFMPEDMSGVVNVMNQPGWGGFHEIEVTNGYGYIYTSQFSRYPGTFNATASYHGDGGPLFATTQYTIYPKHDDWDPPV